jgi:hypothetical protein
MLAYPTWVHSSIQQERSLGCAHRFRPTYAEANVGHPSDSLRRRCALSKNISKKGPQNCRSLHGTPGQVGYAPNDTGRGDDRFSAAPTALGSSSGSISQPFRAGLTFGGRPSGPCFYGHLCRVISPSTCPGKSAAPTARRGRRDDKGKGDACMNARSLCLLLSEKQERRGR